MKKRTKRIIEVLIGIFYLIIGIIGFSFSKKMMLLTNEMLITAIIGGASLVAGIEGIQRIFGKRFY